MGDTVDAQIPLQVKQFEPATAQQNAMSFQQQLQSAQLGQMKIAEGRRNMRNQILLSQIGATPGAIDKNTGMWSDEAIGKITDVDPMLAQNIRQKQTYDKYQIEQLSLERSKALVEDHKAKSEAINEEQMTAISAADIVPADQREQVYAKEWTAGRDRLKKSGIFSDDMQFKDMSYKQAKEIALRRASKESKNPVQQVEEARDQIDDMKTEYTNLEHGSPRAKQLLQKIQDGESAIKRMTAPTAPMVSLDKGDKVPSGYEPDPAVKGKLRPIPGGPADKDKRDVLQADALAAYRARFPMGLMPEVYGKNQPTPEDYTAEYIKNKEGGGKGMPQKDDTAKRFEADKAMKGMTLGKKTAKGIEVMKDGKLVGYYQ